MEDWTAQMITAIDEKLKDARPADLRFFRVEEFKRNVGRTGTFSGKCPECTRRQTDIRMVTGRIDNAVNNPGKDRRDYDRLINRLSSHMQKEHGFYTPYHFTYRYSFYGMLTGIIAGFLLMLIFPENNLAFISAGFTAGLLLAYIFGSRKDRKIREKKMLM